MELKIVNPNADDLAMEFGISEERINEIMYFIRHLIFNKINSADSEVRIKKSSLICEVASVCNTVEELAVAIHLHDGWMFEYFEQVERIPSDE